MSDVTCPRCGSTRVYREERRVSRYAYRHITEPDPRRKTWAGWYVCLNGACGHKWDGITDSDDGALPSGVVARSEISEEEIDETCRRLKAIESAKEEKIE